MKNIVTGDEPPGGKGGTDRRSGQQLRMGFKKLKRLCSDMIRRSLPCRASSQTHLQCIQPKPGLQQLSST